jgi:glycosyltransferase involved in cell wall biosynthesis
MTSERLRKQAGAAVQFLGPVERLRSAYDSARIFIAPTRFAAGLPQKVYEAAANGLPVIVSPLLAQQLNWQHEVQCLVADTPDEWSQAIRRLHGDEQLWQQLRDRALEAVCADVSPAVFSERIRGTIQRLAGAAIA